MRSKYHLTLISIAVLTLFSCRECLAEKYGEILLKNITLKSQRLVHYEIGVLSTGRRYVDIVTADNTIAEKQESWNGVAPLKKPIEQLVKQALSAHVVHILSIPSDQVNVFQNHNTRLQ